MTFALPAFLVAIAVWLIVSRVRVASRRRYLNEYITNNMPSGVLTVDDAGLITSHNPASQRIFGYELSTGRRLPELVEEGPRLARLLDRCLKTGETFTREEFNLTDTIGHRRRIGINLSPITNAKRQVDGAICLLSDLTEIVRLQEQVRLKDNFAALGEMSAGIAHEFKNSLATISGYSQMLDGESDSVKMRNFAKEIEKETRALSRIVNEFLNFARPVRTSVRAIELHELVSGAVDDLRGARPGNYAVEVRADEAPDLVCDPLLLRQAVFNLLINAAEAIDDDGLIRVSVELDENTRRVQIDVSDDGMGMSPDEVHKMFIPFFTTKPSGTGLGLSLVQKIVLAHDGTIEVDSTPGRGTRVSIHLPVELPEGGES